MFGGGGYAINPSVGNRDYWTGGVAATRQIRERLLVGLEADRQGPDTVADSAATRLGIGAIYDLPGRLRLLASGGPTFDDNGRSGFHAFAALGIDYQAGSELTRGGMGLMGPPCSGAELIARPRLERRTSPQGDED